MICCYMLHNGEFNNADDALKFYARKRTHDCKGVTIPSQRRYVEYYARLLNSQKPYNSVKIQIYEIKFSPMPSFSSHQGTVHLKISYIDSIEKKETVAYKEEVPDNRKSTTTTAATHSDGNSSSNSGIGIVGTSGGSSNNGSNISCSGTGNSNNVGGTSGSLTTGCDDGIVIKLDSSKGTLAGDIKVEYSTRQHVIGKKKLFSFWFNTFFECGKGNEGKIDSIPFHLIYLEY